MASIVLAQALPIHCVCNTHPVPCEAHSNKHATVALPSRRNCLLLLTATTIHNWHTNIRAKTKTAEGGKGSRELVKGFKMANKGIVEANKGIEAASKGVEATEKGIEAAEKEITMVVSFGGLAQARTVVGAEAVGVLIATSIMNEISGPTKDKKAHRKMKVFVKNYGIFST